MKILLQNRYHRTQYHGGSEEYAHSIATTLAHTHQIYYLSQSPVNPNTPYQMIRARTISQVLSAYKQIRPDAIHTIGAYVPNYLLALRAKTDRIITYHSYLAPLNPKPYLYRAIYSFEPLALTALYARISVLHHSQTQFFPSSAHRKLFPLNPQLPSAFMTQKKLSQKTPRSLLFVGALDSHHYYKGLATLIQSLSSVSRPIRFDIVGDGPDRDRYQQLARMQIPQHQVNFHGNLTTPELVDLYAQSQVFVLPSTSSSEGFGIVILEALSSGCQIVTTSCIGQASSLKSFHSCYIVPPSDASALSSAIISAIESPIDDPNARKYAQDHNQHRFTNQLNMLYEI